MLLFGIKSSMNRGHMMIMTTSHTDAGADPRFLKRGSCI